jgi:serine/threonine protein phosphatase 1
MVYVCSDLHGYYEEFRKLLEIINFSDNDEMYVLGDVIDRGPEPIKLIQYIISKKNIHMLQGNHEEMMINYLKLQTYNDYVNFSHAKDMWLQNGGNITLLQFSMLTTDEKLKIYNYIIKLPLFKVLKVNNEDVLLVHAGICPYDTGLVGNLSNQIKDDILWIREEFYCSDIVLPFKIIFDHTPTHYVFEDVSLKDDIVKLINIRDNTDKKLLLERYEENSFIYVNNKIGIDGGCYDNKNMLCLRLDDYAEFSIPCKK